MRFYHFDLVWDKIRMNIQKDFIEQFDLPVRERNLVEVLSPFKYFNKFPYGIKICLS